MLGPHCRFTPTCSQYAIEALTKYGVFKGMYLAIRRVFRCHPFSKKSGYDLEILYRFFEEKGYGGRVHPVNFGNLIPGIESEKYDVICGGVTVTDERSKVVNFSKPNMELSYSVFCTAKEAVPYKNLIEFTKDAFQKTFILEDRYILFLDGVRVTFVITIFAVLLGTLLSILICCYRLTGSKIADLLCNMYVSVIEGVPHTVLLMIFYYVVFRNSKLNAVIVAIITMAINFSSYVSEIMITGIILDQITLLLSYWMVRILLLLLC